MFSFFSKNHSNRAMIEAIYQALVDRARDPVLFTDFAVVDSFEGRFETLTLFSVLVSRHLKALPAPAPDLAQDIIDHVFAQFDRALREAGVGDLTVPKRMKTMASAFIGRASAYDQALRSADDSKLVEAIYRNLYASRPDTSENAQKLAEFARAFDQALSSAHIETLVDAIKSSPPAKKFI